MRDRVVRGGAIAAAGLVFLAAACSSSGSDKPPSSADNTVPTVTSQSGGPDPTASVVTSSTGRPGARITNPTTHKTILDPGTGNAATYPTVTTTQPPTTTTTNPAAHFVLQWQFAADYRAHPGTNPFADYTNGPKVWSLRESRSKARDGNYDLLPHYARTFGGSGVSGWYGDSSGCVGTPSIAANTADAPARVCGLDIRNRLAFVYPGQTHMAVVAWTSLFDGNIRIAAGIAELETTRSCGDGVHYYIDKGTTNLSSVNLSKSNSYQLDPITTPVTFGQSIYFIVDAGANNDCDTTQLSIIINRLET